MAIPYARAPVQTLSFAPEPQSQVQQMMGPVQASPVQASLSGLTASVNMMASPQTARAPQCLPRARSLMGPGSAKMPGPAHRGRSPPPPKLALATPEMKARPIHGDILHESFSDLKSALEMHRGEEEEVPKADLLNDKDQRTATQVQLVQKALLVAPESKFRELCAMVACQQVEQEILLRTLRTNMDTLQGQVQVALGNTSETFKGDVQDLKTDLPPELPPSSSGLDELLKSSIDAETEKLWFKVEDKIFQQETELMSWLADFCASSIADTLGEAVQGHSEAIKSLETQVNELREIAQQSLGAWQQLLAENEKSSTTVGQESPKDNVLPACARPQSASIPTSLCKSNELCTSKAGVTDKLDDSERPNGRIDANWVQRLYQGVIAQSSAQFAVNDAVSKDRPASEGHSTNASDSPSGANTNDSCSDN